MPAAFEGVWINNQERRPGSSLQLKLRNSENLRVPFAGLSTSFRQPYLNLQGTWISFDNNEIKILHNKIEFNIKLKEYLYSQLSDTVACDRLL